MKSIGELSHGSAVWAARFFESQDSLRAYRYQVGSITGEEMLAGCDVDKLVADVWTIIPSGKSQYMELHLMLVSGRVVKIRSLFDGRHSTVLDVVFDPSAFPSGLMGRWVDAVFAEKGAVRGKKTKAGVRRVG